MKKIVLLVTILLCMVCFACAEEYTGALDGPIVIDTAGEHTIILNGVTVEGDLDGGMTSYPAVEIKAPATKVTFILKNGTSNTLHGGVEDVGISAEGVEIVIRCENTEEGHRCTDDCGKLITNGASNSGGSFTMNGGNVTASGIFAAHVTITNGTVTAIGVDRGIVATHVTITNGTVTAKGGQGGAGISGKNVTITGGNVNTSCELDGCGIGSNNVLITGGTVTAVGGHGAAGIGSNHDEFSSGMSGTIRITGGIVNARSKDGAAIGSGQRTDMSGSIIIEGGTVTATATMFGVGLGAGDGGKVSGTIKITGGTVNASGDVAIGCGDEGKMSGDIIIDGGNITAAGDVGIGAGSDGEFSGRMIINDGVVVATGASGAGIGCGSGGDMTGTVIVKGGSVTATGSKNAAGIGGGDNGGMSGGVTVHDGTLYAAGGDNAAGIGSGRRGTMSGRLTVKGGDVTIIAGIVSTENAPVKRVPAFGAGYEGTETADMIIKVDPEQVEVGAKAGNGEEDAVNLKGSPWSTKTDLILLYGKDRYLRFRPLSTAISPDLPQTGDSMNFAFLAALAVVGVIGMTLVLRKKDEA